MLEWLPRLSRAAKLLYVALQLLQNIFTEVHTDTKKSTTDSQVYIKYLDKLSALGCVTLHKKVQQSKDPVCANVQYTKLLNCERVWNASFWMCVYRHLMLSNCFKLNGTVFHESGLHAFCEFTEYKTYFSVF